MIHFEATGDCQIFGGELIINYHIISGDIGSGDIGSGDVPVGLDKTAACIEAVNSCGSCFQGTGLDISGFHCAGGLDKTVACIETFNSCVSHIQLLTGDIAIVINSGCTVTDIDATIGIYYELTTGYAELSVIANTKFSISCVQSTLHAQVAFHFCIALNGQVVANGSVASGYISGNSIYCEVTIAYLQIAVCFYISVNSQICHLCIGFIYISVCYISSFSISVFNISRICFRS